jgi:ribosomal protein S18 acetylase RimI-like enzyme
MPVNISEESAMEEVLETTEVLVRTMAQRDLPEIVRIDCLAFGHPRPRYFEVMLYRSVQVTGLQISLVAELEGRIVGYMMASLYYGEYGIAEPTASIDAIGVEPAVRRKHVAHALMEQFRSNVAAVGVTKVRTEVEWDDFDLLGFFAKEGFAPAKRLCLEAPIDPTKQ